MGSSTSHIAGGAPADFVQVRHLRVEGSQEEIGRALAAAAVEAHGDLASPVPADPIVECARRAWFEMHHPHHAARARGVASYFGIAPDDCSRSTDWLGTYALPAGCSVAFYPGEGTKDGHGVLARNFDFPTATLTQLLGAPPIAGERPLGADPWIVETRPRDGYASVTVAIMDVMGAMDGINEHGLAVALLADNETPEPEPTGAPRVGLAEQQVVRYLLDNCATVAEAKHALLTAKHYYFFTPCHFVVADRTGASFVWEHSARRNHEVILDTPAVGGGRVVCTNHLLHRWPDPALLPAEDGSLGTAAFTYGRWRALTDALDSHGVVDRDDITAQFEAVRFVAPLEGGRTFWHAQYDVDDASVAVSFFVRDQGGVSTYTEPFTFRV